MAQWFANKYTEEMMKIMRTQGFKRTMTGVVIGSLAALLTINYNKKKQGTSEGSQRH
ncbi:hypothetical protein GHT06_011334 [Daphnia sinensis]|uniref:Uncharacterized protein n=1 Tax=Daphnia sinensis TaxID=1820382 RepID=A0AAD5PY79_9CRUS|nr:hypothetical protein GHT06_011334 [Daphnia sinensis]